MKTETVKAKSATVDAGILRAALELATVEKKTTIPIITCVLFQPQPGGLRAVTTDLDEWVLTDIDAANTIDEAFTIPYRKTLDLLKGETGEVELTPLENHWVRLSVGGVDYKIAGMGATNFPVHPEIPKAQFQLPSGDLKEMLAHTSFAISAEESRYTLNGLLLRILNGTLIVCATDGHRLAIERREADLKTKKTVDVLIRNHAIQWLQKQIGSEGTIGLATGEHTVFTLPALRTTFFTRKLSGQFPNYEAVMPRRDTLGIIASFVSAEGVRKLLAKVTGFADERSQCVRWNLDRLVTLSAQSTEHGEAEANVPALLEGGEVHIGFGSPYIADVLKIAGKDAIKLLLKDGQTAGVFEIPKFPGFSYVVMPMRI